MWKKIAVQLLLFALNQLMDKKVYRRIEALARRAEQEIPKGENKRNRVLDWVRNEFQTVAPKLLALALEIAVLRIETQK